MDLVGYEFTTDCQNDCTHYTLRVIQGTKEEIIYGSYGNNANECFSKDELLDLLMSCAEMVA